DHGQGMVLGIRAARAAAERAVEGGCGARTALVQAGAAWSAEAGGTSGALWGAALTSLGSALGDDAAVTGEQPSAGLVQADDALGLCRAGRGGPAASPSVSALRPIAAAAAGAVEAAEATADISASKGRARTHGDKSVGTPDPGAISFARIVTRLGEQLAG